MGDPQDRRDGRIAARPGLPNGARGRLVAAALGLTLLAPGLAARGTAREAMAKGIQRDLEYLRQNLPGFDATRFGLEPLVERALQPDPDRPDALTRDLRAAAFRMLRAAKVHVLGKLREEWSQVQGGAPTRAEHYALRRRYVLAFDHVERAFGKSPLYPRELGRPFTTLVEMPSAKHLALVDRYLEYLSRIPDPPPPPSGVTPRGGGTGGDGGGAGGGDGGRQGFELGAPDPSARDPDAGAAPASPDDTPETHGGWALLRIYILATLGALVLVYLAYLVYNAAKGGRNALTYLVTAVRRAGGGGVVGPEEEPFRKAVRLFGKGKLDEALALLERLMEGEGPEAHPARFYALRIYLRQGKMGRVSRELPELALDRFSPDELYLLGSNLQEAEEREGALVIFRWLEAKDATFKDVAQRVEQLGR